MVAGDIGVNLKLEWYAPAFAPAFGRPIREGFNVLVVELPAPASVPAAPDSICRATVSAVAIGMA